MKFKLNESEFRSDTSIGAKKLLCGMEELGHELKQGDEYFDLLYSYISKEDLDEYRNEPLTESSENIQYGVHQFSTNSIIFRGSEEECGKYIDEHPELWDDAEVYTITLDDPHYQKNEALNEWYPNDVEEIELEYDDIDLDDNVIDWTYNIDKEDLYTFIFESCITEDDFPIAFEDTFDPNNEEDWKLYIDWVEENFSDIYSKYENDILENYRDRATDDALENYDPDDYIDWDSMPGGHDDYRFDEALYSSDKEYVAKECSYEMAEEIAQKAKKALKLPAHEVEMLEHDINNLRSNEWADIFAKLSDRSEVKKLFFTYAVEEEELDDLNEGLWNLSPKFKEVWNKLEEYSIAHPDYFMDRRDDFYDAIDNLSEEGIFEIPAEYCEDPENCTEEEAERFINDFLDAIGNMGKLRLYYADLREDLDDEKICCICEEPYEGYGNNAEPVCSGRCCDKCNIERVIPMRFKMMKESLNEGNPVSGKIPESIDSFLQDIAQMYGTIDYGDIMDHDYSEEDVKKLRSLRRKFREEAQYEGSEEAEAAMNDIAEKVAAILKAKNEALLETDEFGNDEIEVNCDGEDCAELITVSVDAEGPHYCCNCAPKYMKQENESLTEEKNSEKLFRKFPELRKLVNEEVEEVITENLSDGTYKITYYLATATRERRPETREDIDNDYRVDTIHAAGDFEAMRGAFRIQRELDESDIDFEMADYDIESVNDFIRYFDEDTDWGDGSILMLKVEGPDGVIYDTGYNKDTFIKELDDTLEYQEKMIADMEKIDPATAKAWREILNMNEEIEPECTDCEEEILEEVDDDYNFEEMDEMLTEDAEIKRFRHIYGVE